MRRISRITVAGAATASLALALAACGGTSTDSGSESKGDKGLAIAYDVGGKGDQSFNDAAYAGLEQAKKEFGYDTADVEPTDGETDADKEQRLTSLAKQGYNPVVGVGYAYAAAMKKVAEKYPDTTFGIVDDATIEAKNVADLVFNEQEASYLAGVAAAKSTKTKTVGFVGGVDVPLIHKFQAGYEQGVKDTDPGSPRQVQGLHPHFGHQGRRQGRVQPREVGRGRQAGDRYRSGRSEVRRGRSLGLQPEVRGRRRAPGSHQVGQGEDHQRRDQGQGHPLTPAPPRTACNRAGPAARRGTGRAPSGACLPVPRRVDVPPPL